MRLLKLAFYSLVGYVIYEMIQGARAEGGGGISRSRRDGSEGLNLTGPGEGTDVEVADDTGTTHRQTVGRGVVS